ncbi:MAG TPA: hypothetical protein VK129_10080 [Terriglobales bacterium]|nr:hypothetical protein [Terriglobales bacterium]
MQVTINYQQYDLVFYQTADTLWHGSCTKPPFGVDMEITVSGESEAKVKEKIVSRLNRRQD